MILLRTLGYRGMEWEISLMVYSLFVVINPFLIKPLDSFRNYVRTSLLFAVALALDMIILSSLFTATNIHDIPGKALYFIIPFLFYPLLFFFSSLYRRFQHDKEKINNYLDNV